MTKLLLAGAVLMSASGFAIPTGKYTGHGTWKLNKDGGRGTHSTSLTITPDSIREVSRFNDRSDTLVLSLKKNRKDYFDIYTGEQKAGKGYCMGSLCHFDYQIGKRSYEETYHWQSNGSLTRVGSRLNTATGYLQVWTDTLD